MLKFWAVRYKPAFKKLGLSLGRKDINIFI